MQKGTQYEDDREPSHNKIKKWEQFDYQRRIEIAKSGKHFEKKEPDNLLRAVLELHSEFSMLLVEVRRLNDLLYQIVNKME